VGKYPINGELERHFSWESRKRLDTPAGRSDAGDAGEGGGRTASATSMFVMAAEGAKGDGGEGTSLDMITIFGVGVFFRVVMRSFAVKNKEESKIVNVT
jgi:hypothetical protein